jgi:cardiolipin synthase
MWYQIDLIYPLLLTAASFLVAIGVSAHVVLYKRDVRAAIGWVGIVWLTPFIGSLLYLAFGINRVSRKARRYSSAAAAHKKPAHVLADEAALEKALGPQHGHLRSLRRYVDKIVDVPLLQGNAVECYTTGEEAYGAMLAEIAKARQSVALSTYIFDNDRVGQMFVEALAAAQQRGAEVRVLIDDVGVRYTFPSIRWSLRKANLRHATFFPTLIPWKFHYSNLRNHRKLLVVDGQVGFTGGMNIRAGHMADAGSAHPIRDMHFRLAGPVVQHLQETFAADWEFMTGEHLKGDAWFPRLHAVGDCLARGIAAGPDTQGDKIRLTLMGALGCARKSVLIMTPYFLPDPGLLFAMNTADLRGVDVQIVLPSRNNLALVQWASTAMLWQVLERGVQVWASAPPFDHTKLMIVDGCWTLFGSANWDPRSLRLNFEFNVECYDEALAQRLTRHVEQSIATAKAVTLRDVDSRSLPVRLRDGFARLLTPYL